MQRSTLAAIFATIILVTSLPAIALDCVDWSETMLPPTPISGVESGQVISTGDWLIVAGTSLQVCDTSIPAAPVVIGTIDLPEPPARLRWHDGTVYLACGASGLLALDLAFPSSPSLSAVFMPIESVVDVAFMDDIAVVVTVEGVLYTLRCNPQGEMNLVGSVDTEQELMSVAVTGTVALAGAYAGLLPVDIADPEAPLPGDIHRPYIGYWWLPLPFEHLIIDGTTAYASLHYLHLSYPFGMSERRIVELDISDPMNPEFVAWEIAAYGPLVRLGDQIAIAGDDSRLTIVELDGFALNARFPVHEVPVSVTHHSAGSLYIAGEERLFHADVTTTRCVPPHATTESAGTVVHGGRYRYLGTYNSYDDGSIDPLNVHQYWVYDMAGGPDLLTSGVDGCYGCDISNYTPRVFGVGGQNVAFGVYASYTYSTRLYDYVHDGDTYLDMTALLAINGNYLWAGDRIAQEVVVYDLGGPGQPVEIGRFEAPDHDLTCRAVHDGNVMICVSPEQLWAVAIGDNAPYTLSLIDADLPWWPHQYELHAGWLLIEAYDELQIWDYTTPTAPNHLGAVPCDLTPTHFAVDGGTIVVGDSQGFQVLMGDPGTMPHTVSPVIEHPHHSLTVSDTHLYVADDDGNLILYDLATPAAPEIVGVAHGPSAERPYVDGDRIYAGYSVFPPPCDESSAIDDPDDSVDPVPASVRAVVLRDVVPNPFNPRTTLAFDLVRPEHATVTIHDLRGRRVATLHDGPTSAGHHTLNWTGVDDRGMALPSGTYLVRLITESAIRTTKAVLIR